MPPPPNVLIRVTPALSGSFAGMGGSHQLSATVTDTLGAPLADQQVTWSVSPMVSGVTVDGAGVVTVTAAAAPGDHQVRAAAGAVTGAATIRVFPRPLGKLVYSATVGNDGKLFVKDLATDAPPVQITDGIGTVSGIGVEPDGGAIFFGQGPIGTADIFRVNADGTGLLNLTNDVTSQNQGPTLHPVTRQVYFTRRIATVAQVFRMDRNGAGLTQVTTGVQAKLLPAISPDGTLLAYGEIFQPGFNQEIVVAGIDGSGPVRFTNRGGIDASPTWVSATRISWSGAASPSNFDIFGADVPGGGNLQNLTDYPGSDSGTSRACLPGSLTFLSSRSGVTQAYHLEVASGLAIPYTFPGQPGMTFARRICP